MRVTVKGSELKAIFNDLSYLMKAYDRARVISISINRESITFTADIGTYYMGKVQYTPIDTVSELDVVVLYVDVAPFISARYDVELELTEYFVLVISQASKVQMAVGNSSISEYKSRGGSSENVDLSVLRRMTDIYLGTKALQKIFNKDFSVSMYGDKAVMRSPTVWVETNAPGLVGVFTLGQLRNIKAFSPDYVNVSDRFEFVRGSSILSVPRMQPTQQNHFDNFTEKLPMVSAFYADKAFRTLGLLRASIGVCDIEVTMYEAGLSLFAEKGGVSIKREFGVDGSWTYIFHQMSDILSMCFGLFGQELVKCYSEGDLLCLKSQDISILMRV